MKSTEFLPRSSSERGAALLTTLLLSTLLLAAGGTLILSTSIGLTTAIDSTSEMQAYTAAEAGLEATLNVFRGNVAPVSTLAGTKMSFLNAVTLARANKVGDTALYSRLSGWLAYSSTYPDRVPITANYTPQNGFAYSVKVEDADPGSHAVGTAPKKLKVTSTGRGPKGATKVLEMIIQPSSVNLDVPAPVVIRGPDDGSPMSFDLGGTPVKHYSGQDLANPSAPPLPAFAVTNANSSAAYGVISTGVTTANPKLGIMSIDTTINPLAIGANAPPATPVSPALPTVPKTPDFLQSADKARALLSQLKTLAQANGRYFSSWSTGPAGSASAPALTFIDGNATVSGGAGLLVVTGNLTLHENVSFSGLVLVLGNGSFSRQGGGPGTFRGAVVVAKFSPNWPASGVQGFGSPTYSSQHDDGNVVTMQWDSDAFDAALGVTGLSVVHVAER